MVELVVVPMEEMEVMAVNLLAVFIIQVDPVRLAVTIVVTLLSPLLDKPAVVEVLQYLSFLSHHTTSVFPYPAIQV